MKILSIGKPKESLLSLPPETAKQLTKAATETSKQLIDKGKILAQYYSPTSQYIFVILDYDTAEEWMKDLMSMPILSYYDQETYPIVDFPDALKALGIT
jgi:muconolactone delta-isomerase